MRAGFLYTFFSFCYSSQTVTEWTNQKGKHAASILFPLILKSAGMLCFTMYMWKMLTDWVNWDTSWSLINRRSVFGKLTSRALGHHLVVWPCYLLTQHNCFFRLRLIFFSWTSVRRCYWFMCFFALLQEPRHLFISDPVQDRMRTRQKSVISNHMRQTLRNGKKKVLLVCKVKGS